MLPNRAALAPPGANRQHEWLAARNPDYLFIGNSMLDSRIDPDHFQRLLGGAGSAHIQGDGLFTAHWYLWLKNQVAASGIRPRAVFIFFRDTVLTSPNLSTTGQQERRRLASASVDDEAVLQRILNRHKGLSNRLVDLGIRLYPVQLDRYRVDWLLDSLALLPALPGYLAHQIDKWSGAAPVDADRDRDRSIQESRSAFKWKLRNELFSPNNFRPRAGVPGPDGDDGAAEAVTDFDRRLPDSLLPEMVRIGREHRLNLVFIQVKPRPGKSGFSHERPREEAYTAALAAYLRQNGMGFHSFMHDPALQEHHYWDGAHIAPQHRPWYTEHFVRSLPEIFAQPPSGPASGPPSSASRIIPSAASTSPAR